MMNVLLLETLALWNGLSSGIQVGICMLDSSISERFFAAVAAILFLSHLALSALIYLWRDDFLIFDSNLKTPANHSGDTESSSTRKSSGPGGYHQSIDPESSQFVIDDDNEAEL